MASTLTQARENCTSKVLGNPNLNEVYGLLESRLGGENRAINYSSSSGNNLTTTSMDRIGVKCNITYVDSDSSCLFFSHDSFLGCPLEACYHGVLDFVEVLDTLRGINKEIGTRALWTEAPDFSGFIYIPVEFV